MHGLSQPTAYGDVNVVLAELLTQVQTILGVHLIGMYLSGSLALGDFDPSRSDIDLMVVTDDVLAPLFIDALRALHARFDASDSPWAAKVEAVYIARDALRYPTLLAPNPTQYPQVEKRRGFFMDRLEDGWLSQCALVREHGVVLAGPDPKTLIDPVDLNIMRRAMARIPILWLDKAHNDPSWLAWLCTRANQAFVTLTLCRLLFTLEIGAIASKPQAARWAQKNLGVRWVGLIERALAGIQDHGVAPEEDVVATVALVEYTVEQFRQWQSFAA